MYQKSIFLFKRDLRLEDNTGLVDSLKKSKEVIPCFIFDDRIKKSNISETRWNFLIKSLYELDTELKKENSSLQVFTGNIEKIIEKIISDNKINAIFTNIDFSDFSKSRDSRIYKICKSNNVDFNSTLDFIMHDPNKIKTNEGRPYTVYSHFYKKARQFPVRQIQKNSKKNYSKEKISKIVLEDSQIQESSIEGGRKEGLEILKNMKNFKDYKKVRDYPALDGTTKLSAHNKFGTISIREVFHSIKNELGMNHTIMGEIYWREFFWYILFYFPFSQKQSFNKKFQKIPWSKSKSNFKAWCEGKTGFPIVDAGMNELNATGFMHNRVRMIVASFLTKDLHIDWKWGERYFARCLVDYDPAVNVGNWQWVASTGCDAAPYFRIFNPWRQQERFDPKCNYIKKWIPELKSLKEKQIHNLWKEFPSNIQYPKPIVVHSKESEITKEVFRKTKS